MHLNDAVTRNIASAYDSVLRNDTNWLLLHYNNDQDDELVLYANGSDGLEELKTRIYDLDRVFVAFYREELEANPGFILINYIPLCTPAVQRARALVHSRRVGVIFKNHQTMLTVDNLSQMTTTTIHKALVDPESFRTPAFTASNSSSPTFAMGHSFSSSSVPERPNRSQSGGYHTSTKSKQAPRPIVFDAVRRSFSETYAPHMAVPQYNVPPVPPIPKAHRSPGMFSGFLRKIKDTHDDNHDDVPPPPPPKDSMSSFTTNGSSPTTPRRPPRSSSSTSTDHYHQHNLPQLPRYGKPHSPSDEGLSEFGMISKFDAGLDTVVIEPHAPVAPAKSIHDLRSLTLTGKWARQDPLPADPKERERRRLERQRQRELEEQQAVEEERRRQEEIKRLKAEQQRQEEEEERMRKEQLKEKLRRIAEEKEYRRRLEQEEEESERRELERKKRVERERRIEESKKLERWRQEQQRLREEEARKAAAEKKRDEEARLRKIQLAEKVIVHGHKTDSLLTGHITIQFPESLFWKRRYFKLVESTLYLYRSPKDMASPLETQELKGQVKGLKEWSDGYEDLEAIPFSFVIEFKDHRTWSVYADSETDKFRILGLLKHASGL